jgi:hypothetical protein
MYSGWPASACGRDLPADSQSHSFAGIFLFGLTAAAKSLSSSGGFMLHLSRFSSFRRRSASYAHKKVGTNN